jgi:hypothetical protein
MIGTLVTLLIYLLILGLIVGLIYWVTDAIPIPQPINRWIKIICVVIVALVAILILLQVAGGAPGISLQL